jgi:hypothetical protein
MMYKNRHGREVFTMSSSSSWHLARYGSMDYGSEEVVQFSAWRIQFEAANGIPTAILKVSGLRIYNRPEPRGRIILSEFAAILQYHRSCGSISYWDQYLDIIDAALEREWKLRRAVGIPASIMDGGDAYGIQINPQVIINENNESMMVWTGDPRPYINGHGVYRRGTTAHDWGEILGRCVPLVGEHVHKWSCKVADYNDVCKR